MIYISLHAGNLWLQCDSQERTKKQLSKDIFFILQSCKLIDKLIFMGRIYEKRATHIISWNKYHIAYAYIKWYAFIMTKCTIKLDLTVNKIHLYYNISPKDYNVRHNYPCVLRTSIMSKIYIVSYLN